MNHARIIYLATYFWIDVSDGRIKNAYIFYRFWKYWHYPMNHWLAIIIYSTYEIYLEVVKVWFFLFGKLIILWHIESSGKYFQVGCHRTINCRSDIQEIIRWGQWQKWWGRSSKEGWEKLCRNTSHLLRRTGKYAKTSLHYVSMQKNQVLLRNSIN